MIDSLFNSFIGCYGVATRMCYMSHPLTIISLDLKYVTDVCSELISNRFNI